ncbi:MAG: serine hydrolase [Tepidisphaeraceae bacterium]
MRRTLCFVILVLLTRAAASDSPRLSDCADLKDLAPRWKDAMESMGVPGFAVAVVRDGKIICADGFGVCDPVSKRPVDASTIFYIASCTKTFTAMTIAVLAEQGKFSLDDPVKKILPRFDLADTKAAESITIRDLLCHRPGLRSQAIVFNDAYTGQITDDLYYRLLKQTSPAGNVNYSNIHFTLLGRVMEQAGGKSWKEVMDDLVLKPAGMTRTTAYASRMYADADSAKPVVTQDGKQTVSPLLKTDRTMHAAGGMGSSANDLARWLILHTSAGQIDGNQVIPEPIVKQMLARQSDHEPSGKIRRLEGFGLAWELGTYRGRPYATHGGGYVGAAAHISLLPEQRIGVVVLTNFSPTGAGLCDVVSIDVYDRLLGLKEPDLLPQYKKRAAQFFKSQRDRKLPENPAIGAGHLSLAPERYAGNYHNDDFGDLRISLTDGSLVAEIGDLRPVLCAGEKPDELGIQMVPQDDLSDGRFEITGGEVIAVVVVQDEQPIRFARVN